MSLLGIAASVVMVGHSLFGSDGPDMLQEALRAGTGQGTVRAQIINGAPLKYNWDESANAEGIDARSVLPEGETTHLILTEAIPLANHLEWSETYVYAQAFAGLAASANPDAHIYVQETWHSLKSGTGEPVENDEGAGTPWRVRLDQDLPAWQEIVAQVAAVTRDDRTVVGLIPAGQAMARLYDEIAAERIPGLTDISALFADDIHLNDTGHYFVAMVQYATLTGQDPLGLPVDFHDRWGQPFDTPDEDLARALQRVAFEAVQAYGGTAVAPVPPASGPAAAATSAAVPTGPPAMPETPAADLIAGAQGPVEGTNHVAIGLAAVTDWSTQAPFIDLMKTARPWLGHEPGRFGGMEYADLLAGGFLDDDGWPLRKPRSLSSIGTLILTDIPVEAQSLAGGYRLAFDGKGVIEVTGRAENVRYGDGEVTFDYTPGPGSVDIRIQRINTSDPPRNITVVKQDNLDRFAAGAVFNPDWTARIGQFSALRFMDWMETNNSTLTNWADRPLPGDATWSGGVPIEVMVDLANTLETDIWVNVPHLADDDFVRRFAELVKERLDPALKVYVEFSNEVWNWQFEQARWADVQARARWDQQDKWMQYYGMRAAEVARLWSGVFAGGDRARLVNVISSQTGWLGLETEALTAPLAVAEGLSPPAEAFDAYAVTGYFAAGLGTAERAPMLRGWLDESRKRAEAAAQAEGLSGQAAQDYTAAHRFDFAFDLAGRELRDGGVSGVQEDTVADLITRVWPYHAQVAQAHGLDLIMYEGGSHVVGIGAMVDDAELTAFFQALNYAPQMGALYTTLLEGWKAVGGQLFNAYSDVYAPTKWGSWGALRYLDDDNPRWDALVAFQ
ncbi:hypothetical protein FIU94_16725 [Sulfitobacter sp. THAF37]|uniref:hypothetical protein n=1 Tax=Sulfitobacter sp. THAF37 TaxID=2587855 RepID=UPI0012682CC6|nr:hypothetical protein [Sulfitobacter sp. THAF37]QFT60476.1 hypothetical protein FIU94_16725 [Sulfitobacter sp. THAF37]